jgi:DNA-binding transcriptional ArsR family regulator
MELDFKTVKALSSPTRIQILRRTLNGENTTTQISKELDKSKSTVSDHLQTLSNAGLLDKDEKEGRKRVTYSPTGKAKAIVEGRERNVKFSIATGMIFAIAGTAAAGRYAVDSLGVLGMKSAESATSGSDGGEMNAMMAESADTAARNADKAAEASSVLEPELVFLAAGILFLSTSALAFAYGYLMNQLGS